MPRYYVTFGEKYANEPHPIWPGAHPEGYIEIDAEYEAAARLDVCSVLKTKWELIFHEKDFIPANYSKGRLATLKEIRTQLENTAKEIISESALNKMSMESEGEKEVTLTSIQMMVINNVSNLFNRFAAFPRTDKYEKEIDDCIKNIKSGLGINENESDPKTNLIRLTIDEMIRTIKGF